MQNWYTVPELVQELQGKVSDDQIRTLCRSGMIPGAWNKGTGRREYWLIPESGWNKFQSEPRPIPKVKVELPTMRQAIRNGSKKKLLRI